MKQKSFGFVPWRRVFKTIALITIAINVGKAWQRIETKLDYHDAEITVLKQELKDVQASRVKSHQVRKPTIKNLEDSQGPL